MPKIRLGDLLNTIEDKDKVRILGYSNRQEYTIEEVAKNNYFRRIVKTIKPAHLNYNVIVEILFEDELH